MYVHKYQNQDGLNAWPFANLSPTQESFEHFHHFQIHSLQIDFFSGWVSHTYIIIFSFFFLFCTGFHLQKLNLHFKLGHGFSNFCGLHWIFFFRSVWWGQVMILDLVWFVLWIGLLEFDSLMNLQYNGGWVDVVLTCLM